jgi:hypothetical protein
VLDPKQPNGSYVGLNERQIMWYQKYWPESLLVLTSPHLDFFYAQGVDHLRLIPIKWPWKGVAFDLADFDPLEKHLPKVDRKFIYEFYGPFLKNIRTLDSWNSNKPGRNSL